MKHEDVTICVPTLATPFTTRALKLCLESLYETFDGPVIVAENGGANYKWKNQILSEAWPYKEIKVKEQGQCRATNEAARQSETPWIMIMNDDMVAPPGWFENLTSEVERYGLLVASPNLVEPRKGAPPFIEKFCGGIGTKETEPDFDKDCFLDFVENYREHANNPDVSLEDGFNLPLLIRKEVWDTISGYDTNFDPFGSNSDSDLQYRIMLSGITPKRVRNSLIYHFSQTSGTFHPENREAWEKNQRYFKEKWGVERASSPEIWYSPEINKEEIKFHPSWEGVYEKNRNS